MEYLMLITDEDADGEAWQPEAADFEAWVVDAHARGVRIRGNHLRPPTEATLVRVRSGGVVLSDVPPTEPKEWVAAYDLLEAATFEEAVEVAASASPRSHRPRRVVPDDAARLPQPGEMRRPRCDT